MGKSIYTICLDLQNVDSQVTIYAKQGDTDRLIHFTLRDGGKAFELKDTDILVLSTITPGGKTIEESVEIKNGTAVYEFSEYLTASIGAMNVELRIYSEGKNVISASFTLVVEARNGVAKSVTEQDSFTALDTVYAQAQKAIEDAEIATTNANNASVGANAAAKVANEAAESANNAVTSVGGAIEEARLATSAAQSAAEEATEAAKNAENMAYRASDAAQFANIEAQGAIEAAKKANDAAKRANDAIDRLENEGLDIDKSLFASAIKDTASGTAVALTDVSPFEHTLGVRARSKNILNPDNPYSATSTGTNGWKQENGYWIGLNVYYKWLVFGAYHLSKGQTITLAFNCEVESTNGRVCIGTNANEPNNIKSTIAQNGKNTISYTSTEETEIYIGFVDYLASAGNYKISNIMLCYGTDSEYVPFVDVPTKEVSYSVESSNDYFVTITDADLFVQKTLEAGFTYEPNEMVEFSLGLITDDTPYPLYYNGNKIMDVDENCGLGFPELSNTTIYITVYNHTTTAVVYQYGGNMLDIEGREVVNFGGQLNTSKRTFTGKGIIKGFAYSNWYAPSNVTSFEKHKNGFSMTCKENHTAYGVGFDFKASPNMTFVAHYKELENITSFSAIFGSEYDKDGNFLRYCMPKSPTKTTRTFTMGENTAWVVISFQNTTTSLSSVYNNVYIGVDTFAGFEEYKEPTTYPISTDGTVEGVTSLYPTTTLVSDTEGVVLDVDYIVDTKKYIDKIKAELQALVLGG